MAGSTLSDIANEKSEMEMTPMIDVTFLLLIFFMCTLKFKVLEGKLQANLPDDVGVRAKEDQEIETFKISIRVLEAGRQVVDEKGGTTRPYTDDDRLAGRRFDYEGRVVQYDVGGFGNKTSDLAELRSLVTSYFNNTGAEDARVELNPLPRTIYLDVLQVLDQVADVGVEKINFSAAVGQGL